MTKTKAQPKKASAAEKLKAKAKNVADKTKAKAKAYGEKLAAAYDRGYRRGYEDGKELPKVRGARTSATVGYGRGLKDQAQAEKAQERLNKARSENERGGKRK